VTSYPEKEKETYDEHYNGNNNLAGGRIFQLALFVDRYRSARRAGTHFRLSKTVYPNFRCTALVWFAATPFLAQSGFFLGVGIPLALVLTLIFGVVLMFSPTFRKLLTITPMHWIIGIQVFRVLGGMWLIGYAQGQLPGMFALPAGIGDTLTGLTAPLVAYWYYKKWKGARLIAFIWCLFGTLDLLDAITLANLTNPALIAVLPFVLIPAFGVPRSLVLHGYTFWLLGKRRTEKAIRTEEAIQL
jgi:hypothetical protein